MKQGLHPRSRHAGSYDFKRLCAICPELARFVTPGPAGRATIDFANPDAVLTLNRALLGHFYGVVRWEIPAGFLCPPIPGRADYLHHAADLLASGHGGAIPRGPSVRVLDVGVGASCIYPLIGHKEYGWSFLGSDIDPAALASARKILRSNPAYTDSIELRLQASRTRILKGLIREGERFELSICNPPFHASPGEALEGTRRKWKNLGRAGSEEALNFGGTANELWCQGGELAFVRRMIEESTLLQTRVRWFSTLVSKESNLKAIHAALKKAKALEVRTIPMAQGQKKSRIVAWTYRPA